jgi:disulfide bond formation protein DsbB
MKSLRENEPEKKQRNKAERAKASELLSYAAWIVALIATIGSLFFSEVMQLPPCLLCWYQRIAMYPLIVLIGAGIIMRDHRMKFYALPLTLAGLAISVYHNLLYYGILPESIAPCTQGVSCTSRQIEWFGFITIPLLALAAFILITICLTLLKSEKE